MRPVTIPLAAGTWEIGPFAVAENLDAAVPLETWCQHMSDPHPAAFCTLARSWNATVAMICTTPSVVFGPDGEVLATYRKIHLSSASTPARR
ncbi:MAG: hypothetical protein R2687_03145 [Candidatus Nanopelagicales bacterium]